MSHCPKVGMGCQQPKWVLHIANRPQLEWFQQDRFHQIESGQIPEVINATSNHWRKVFSIMAKISFALFDTGCNTWQQYRDTKLLTDEGFEAIDFLPYCPKAPSVFSIICGFQYAEQQVRLSTLLPHINQPKLLMSEDKRLMVTPYFDWRQLNNEILGQLLGLIEHREWS